MLKIEKTARHIHVSKFMNCAKHILVAEDLTNKLNELLAAGVQEVRVSWIDLPLRDDPEGRGYRIIGTRAVQTK